ncbi:MAG: family acetyltransferase [Paenibacillaceae bacterium]|jgi:ribosomal protein S18 acetylase RimI-like enzyme|nr:family acetyltransferase [Paenibacillaceae bacterium]
MNLIFSKVDTVGEMTELAELAANIWREYYISIITMDQIEYMIGKFQSASAVRNQIEEQGYEYYAMREDGHTVGYLSVKEDGGKLFLSKFYVAKEHRGKGYASQAMTFLEQLCKDRGLGHIWLTVNRHNESSIGVYQKKGFRTVREQVADIGNGYVMDDYVMEKVIPVS